MIGGFESGDEALARREPEEQGEDAHDYRREREPPAAEKIAEDAERDPHGPGGDVRAAARDRGDDAARGEDEAQDAGDPACERPRRSSRISLRFPAGLRRPRVSVLAQIGSLGPRGRFRRRSSQSVPGRGTCIIPSL